MEMMLSLASYLAAILAPLIPIMMMPDARPRSRSRSPVRAPAEQPPAVPEDQEHHQCAQCEGCIPTAAGWENWVYMAPGGQEGFPMLKRILSILQYGAYINKRVCWVGAHGTYMPFCKSCMIEVAGKLRENNSFTQSSAHANMTDEDRQRAEQTDEHNMDLALMAGLLSQQFFEKSRDAMVKLPSDDQNEPMAVD